MYLKPETENHYAMKVSQITGQKLFFDETADHKVLEGIQEEMMCDKVQYTTYQDVRGVQGVDSPYIRADKGPTALINHYKWQVEGADAANLRDQCVLMRIDTSLLTSQEQFNASGVHRVTFDVSKALDNAVEISRAVGYNSGYIYKTAIFLRGILRVTGTEPILTISVRSDWDWSNIPAALESLSFHVDIRITNTYFLQMFDEITPVNTPIQNDEWEMLMSEPVLGSTLSPPDCKPGESTEPLPAGQVGMHDDSCIRNIS